MSLFRPASTRQLAIGLTVLRVITGAIFVAHGSQKLFVYGFAGVTGSFGQMGIPMPGIVAPFIALLELFGGLALIFGLLTRLAALGLALEMLGAILFVHGRHGLFLPTGSEFALTLLGSSTMLALTGAGDFSLDARFAARQTPESAPERARRAA